MNEIKESDIGGAEIKLGIRFNECDEREYLDIVDELINKMADVVEECGHENLVSMGRPLKHSEVN